MSVNLSPLGGAAAQFFDNNGVILSGGKIYTYAAGTTTPQTTYTSSSGATPHSNPIILDSAGRIPGGEIWLTVGSSFKFVLETSTGILLGTYDNISAVDVGSVSVTWNNGATTFTGIDLQVNNIASALNSNLLDLNLTGASPARFYITRRGHIYSNSTTPIFKLGPDTLGSQGNVQVAGTDIISRIANFGTYGSHGVFDICVAGGTIDAPTSITNGWQICAFACRSWDTTTSSYITVGDITWGATQDHGAGSFGSGMNFYITKNNTDDLFRWLHTDVTARAVFSVAVRNEAAVNTGDNHIGFYSQPSLVASASEGDVFHFRAGDTGIGSGATLSRQTAFRADDLTTGTALNIGFRSMLSGAGNYNLFIDGASPNYIEANLGIGTNSASEKLHVVGNIRATGFVRTQSTTVSGLTDAATAGAGARAFVTDATATTFLSVVAGGGSNKVPVVSDGAAWLIG